jgi:hypothetical protein
MIATPYLLKARERLLGDEATCIDLCRDFGLLGMFVIAIIFHWKQFKRL